MTASENFLKSHFLSGKSCHLSFGFQKLLLVVLRR